MVANTVNTEHLASKGTFTLQDIYHYLYHCNQQGMDLKTVLEIIEYGDVPPRILANKPESDIGP